MDTTTLKARRPWYSLEYNDNISALTVAPWSMTDISAYLVSHQVGQKQYELTNHLGNVQATVSDLPYAGGEYYITRKAPALPAVYDYYPFGMLMPGRYTSDTTGKCMTISQTKWVTNWMDSCYLTPALYTATIGGAVVNTTGGTLNVSTSNVGDGIELTLAGIVPGVEQELNFEFEEVYRGTPQIWVTEEQNGVQVSLGSVLVRDKGVTTLRVKSKFGNIKVLVLDIYEVKMKKVCVKVPQLIQQEMLVDVCSDMKDRYRFGFNGQEKVNEWSGVGNFNDFLFRGQDARIGRFISVDPVTNKFPWNSPFAFAENIVINGVDAEGREWKTQHRWSDKLTDKTHIKAVGESYTSGMTYKDAWAVMVPKLLKEREGKTFDCANLSIDVMVNFAYIFKLPVHFDDYKKDGRDPTFDNDKFGFRKGDGKFVPFKLGDWRSFADAIGEAYGAPDLFHNRKITSIKSFDKIKPGDLVGWKYKSGHFHSQTISEVSDSWWDWNEDPDYYKTIQGSTDDNDNGVQAFEKEYDIEDVKGGYGQDAKTQLLEWNTNNFDNN